MLGAIGKTRMSHQADPLQQQCLRQGRCETGQGKSTVELCEVGESEGDNDCCQRALSGTDDMSSVDRDLDVAGRGAHDRIVGSSRWVYWTAA